MSYLETTADVYRQAAQEPQVAFAARPTLYGSYRA